MSPSIQGKTIIALRRMAGFANQSDLARAAGIDPSKISRLETDKPVNLTLKTIEKLAAALKVTPKEIFTEPRPETDAGHAHPQERSSEGSHVLEALRQALDAEVPAEDSWRGDVQKAIAVLGRALYRSDPGTARGTVGKARR